MKDAILVTLEISAMVIYLMVIHRASKNGKLKGVALGINVALFGWLALLIIISIVNNWR